MRKSNMHILYSKLLKQYSIYYSSQLFDYFWKDSSYERLTLIMHKEILCKAKEIMVDYES